MIEFEQAGLVAEVHADFGAAVGQPEVAVQQLDGVQESAATNDGPPVVPARLRERCRRLETGAVFHREEHIDEPPSAPAADVHLGAKAADQFLFAQEGEQFMAGGFPNESLGTDGNPCFFAGRFEGRIGVLLKIGDRALFASNDSYRHTRAARHNRPCRTRLG